MWGQRQSKLPVSLAWMVGNSHRHLEKLKTRLWLAGKHDSELLLLLDFPDICSEFCQNKAAILDGCYLSNRRLQL